ncbi:hypothetical protein SRHO_G00196180 [Serrasalmus rhombeus]
MSVRLVCGDQLIRIVLFLSLSGLPVKFLLQQRFVAAHRPNPALAATVTTDAPLVFSSRCSWSCTSSSDKHQPLEH